MTGLMLSCELCIALEREPYRVIYQDDHAFVMVNSEPVKDGHVMVLPKRHVENLKDLDPQEARAFLQAVDICMRAVTETYGETPMCMVNGWKHRSQAHLHAHVLPSKDGLRGLYSASEGLTFRKRADHEMLTAVADRLKHFFE